MKNNNSLGLRNAVGTVIESRIDLFHRLFTANSFDLIDEDAFLGLPHLEYL